MKLNYKLPYDERQKYQIGDIVKIVKANNFFRYPPIKDEDTFGYGLNLIITGSYWQLCGSNGTIIFDNGEQEPAKNLFDYSVFITQELNPQCFNSIEYYYKGYQNKQRYFGWSWVEDSQLEFIRHPTKTEKEFALKQYWDEIERYGRHFGWDDVKTYTKSN